MKDSILINNGLPNNFWAEAMKKANYLCNRLFTRSKNYGKMISKESQTTQRQNFQYVRIFRNLVLSNMPKEKRIKSDYQKIWQGILIGYSPNTNKYFHIQTSQTKQVIIVNKPYFNELE